MKSRFAIGLSILSAAALLFSSPAEAAQRSSRPAAKQARPAAPKAAAPAPVSVRVEPASVQLSGPEARVQLLVTGKFADGTERDLTRSARYLPDARLAVSPAGVASPRVDGKGQLKVQVGARALQVPVTVTNSKTHPPTRLVTDVVPVLTKIGCNMGACHGAAAGQGGFRLSLRGFDPDLDFEQITKANGGARIDRAKPEQSLFLKKATAEVPHAGGPRFKKESEEYAVLLRWIREGAAGVDPALQVTDIEVRPAERVIPKAGLTQQLQVIARYSDGSVQDVTRWARFASNDDAVVTVDDATGLLKAEQGGAAAVMVSYSGFVKVARALVPVQAKAPAQYAALPRANFIDDLVLRKLEQLRIEPSPLAPDAEFLRRVYLDLIGTLPTPAEVEQFLGDKSPDKRAKLIDALLERPEFADYRALKLSDLLRVNSQYMSQEGADAFYRWIRNRTRENAGYDKLVRELLTARGSGFHVGPANYFRIANNPEELAETTSQTFLGVRMNCAKCHNHPFERWQQRDYYSLAAFFARVGTKGGPEFGENQVYVKSDGEVKHPKSGQVLAPRFLGGDEAVVPVGGDRRAALAEWLTSRENVQFARVAVNRLWADLFGRGIVDAVDDFRVSNPPANDELLDALAQEFVRLNYDVKAMLRLIANSRTYQLSSEMRPSNERDTRHFARAYPKRMPAEVLADALDAATGKPSRYGSLPVGTRALQIPDSRINSYLLDVFGRPKREIVCACERDPQPNLSQMLNLINSGDLNNRIAAEDGRIATALKADLTDAQIVRQLYLATLSREPKAEELKLAEEQVRKSANRKAALEDVLWALLNTQEFIFNH
jgi:uncharacterized protein DUF1549/uncharacterized protein DUF1553/Big-like domain-containing protein